MTEVGAVAGFCFLSFLGFLASRPPLSLLCAMGETLRLAGCSGQQPVQRKLGEIVRRVVVRQVATLRR